MKKVYYNDNDKGACAWLRQLIKDGLIPDGDVDERSIIDVKGDDVRGYTQAHFFAGIGGWGHALALSGWPQDRRVWTGSCPCQPFSCAGKGLGEKDKRHLWPEFRRLIKECQPTEIIGEQVASKAGRLWFSGVRVDLEELGYVVGAADLCAAGIGAPHIRQRLYWVARGDGLANPKHDGRRADEQGRGQEGRVDGRPREAIGVADPSGARVRTGHGSRVGASKGTEGVGEERERIRADAGDGDPSRGLADGQCQGLEGHPGDGDDGDEPGRERAEASGPATEGRVACGLADADRERRVGEHSLLREEGQERGQEEVPETSRGGEDGGLADAQRPERGPYDERGGIHGGRSKDTGGLGGGGQDSGLADAEGSGGREEPGAMAGIPRQEPSGEQQRGSSGTEPASGCATRRFTNWDASRWHECQDKRQRRVPLEPEIFPMAIGLPSGRVGLLRGAGNAISPPLAAEFVMAYMEASDEL